jgi:hypothetical protein
MIAWLEKYALLFKVAMFAIAVVAAYCFGYHVRSLSAERDTATVDANQAKAVVVQQEAHDAQTQANASAGEQAAQDMIGQQAETKDNFKTIYRDVVRYVETNPAPAVCDLDAAGLRDWNAANAGKPSAPSQPDATH